MSSGLVYTCDANNAGATPIYELVKGASDFFSLSKVEKQKAVEAGYTATFLTYACLGQPHDHPSVMHTLNVFHEFRNLYP
jgi:hypothetical protein